MENNNDIIEIASTEINKEKVIEEPLKEIAIKDEKIEKKKVAKEPKKKPEAKTKSEVVKGRSNTITAVVESMKNQEKQSNKIIATGVGASKFNNLLSMFDKSKISIDQAQDQRQSAKVANELDMNKFNIFNSNKDENKAEQSKEPIIKPSLSIKERMELLNKEREKNSTQKTTKIDPLLEIRKQQIEDNNEIDDINEEKDDLELSAEEELGLDEDENIENPDEDI
jgi:hypothetical protein